MDGFLGRDAYVVDDGRPRPTLHNDSINGV